MLSSGGDPPDSVDLFSDMMGKSLDDTDVEIFPGMLLGLQGTPNLVHREQGRGPLHFTLASRQLEQLGGDGTRVCVHLHLRAIHL
jgi:hypothetical protein